MKYYKDTAGNVYAYNAIQTPKDGLTKMSQVEVNAHLNPPVDPDQMAADVRAQRDALLRESDWVTTRAYDMQEPVPQGWIDYRQALRDVPEQAEFPDHIDWPIVPEPV